MVEEDEQEGGDLLLVLPIVSIFAKTLTLSVHAGLLWCFHNPLNSDMDHMIFNVHICNLLACAYTQGGTSVYSLTQSSFVVCTEFDSGEISGQAQSLAHNSCPSVW